MVRTKQVTKNNDARQSMTELELLLAIDGLLESHLSAVELLHDLLLLTLEENDEVTKVAKPFLILCFELLHSDADLPLMDDVFELLLQHLGEHVSITFEVIHLLLLHLLDLLLDGLGVDLVAGVEDADVLLHLLGLLRRNDDLTVRLAHLDEVDDLASIQVLLVADRLDT